MPLISSVKFDPLLTNISLQFQAAPEGYLADEVLPPVPVQKESAAYWVYDKSRMDAPDSKRAPRSNYNRVDWNVTTDTYLAEQYGLEGEIDDEERTNAASPLDLDVDTTEIVTDMVLNNREVRVAGLVLNTAVVTQNTTLSGANQWNDPASDPLNDIKVGRTTTYAAAPGYTPNTFVIGYLVFESLKMHPDIKELRPDERTRCSVPRTGCLAGSGFPRSDCRPSRQTPAEALPVPPQSVPARSSASGKWP